MKGLRQLLSAVSRSFYLSMRFLPREMRPGVAVGYLLARATDTVADTVDMDCRERLALLRMMGATVARGRLPGGRRLLFWPSGHSFHRPDAPGGGGAAGPFSRMPGAAGSPFPREQMLVRQVLSTIVEGQAWDLEYFEARSSVSCPEQLEHYTYMVAGCVGEFWTRLGLLALGSGFSTQPEDQLLRWGRHYGMGLQLVNILRDREEDLSRGRSYLPTSDVQPWLDRAERWLKEGVFYAESLRNGRLRFSTVLPAWLGLDTLELLQRQEQPGTGKVKITRGTVHSRMWKAFLFSWKEAL